MDFLKIQSVGNAEGLTDKYSIFIEEESQFT